jgi:hypothetical protein
VRALPAAPMSRPLAELLLDVGAPGGPRRRKKFMLVVGEPACAAMLVALGARLPHADLTALPWPEAAARLGVATRVPWYSDWKIIGGVVLMGASAVALALPTRPRGGSELAGYMAGGAVVALGGLALLIVGLVQRGRGR